MNDPGNPGGRIDVGLNRQHQPSGSWLHQVFLADDPTAAAILGPLDGPLLAVVSFLCSIGNIPLGAVLWNGGPSFGGVVSFIFADLIVLPVLLIYRKYYGTRMALFLFATSYAAMAGAGYIIEIAFGALGLIPSETERLSHQARHLLELHHLAQHVLPATRGTARKPPMLLLTSRGPVG